jgi:hypothetical protein
VTAMTLDELLARESIRQTIVGYTMAGDRLREDDFVAVFTDDAVLESDGVPDSDSFRYEGSQAIRAWIARWRSQPEGAPRTHQATFVRHHLSTSQIELTSAATARARTYWTAYTDIGPDHCGYYIDAFRKVGEHWLIEHRRVRMDWRSSQSLFTTAIQRSR